VNYGILKELSKSLSIDTVHSSVPMSFIFGHFSPYKSDGLSRREMSASFGTPL
jgi:hypothetical protein